jgi:hypothetical protein
MPCLIDLVWNITQFDRKTPHDTGIYSKIGNCQGGKNTAGVFLGKKTPAVAEKG